MSPLGVAKAGVLVFVAAIAQVSVFSGVHLLGATPDVLLLTIVAIALLRGPIYGAAAGFVAGLLVDTANLETLGVTSLLLTLTGYWAGRYGETLGGDRVHVPFLAVAAATFAYSVGALALHFLLNEPAPAREVLLDSLFPSIFLNLLLTWPLYALCRRLLPPPAPARAQEVRLLG
jgi:rod shape-determining protein MreD